MLSAGQKAHFDTFGFLVLRELFSPEEMKQISAEADDILSEARQGQPFVGESRQIVMSFVERRPFLRTMADDDRIYLPIEDLLGPEFMWVGGDGNLYVGDTQWHSDSSPDPKEYSYTRIKVALYLDPVSKDTGCLRVVPGSHLPPLHEELEPLRHVRRAQRDYGGKTVFKEQQEEMGQGSDFNGSPFDLSGPELPAFPLESQPGDVVLFQQRLWHASFGGKTGRRMFTLNYAQKPVIDDHFELLKLMHESNLLTIAKSVRPSDPLYSEGFVTSERPRIRSMMATPKELGMT